MWRNFREEVAFPGRSRRHSESRRLGPADFMRTAGAVGLRQGGTVLRRAPHVPGVARESHVLDYTPDAETDTNVQPVA